MITVQKGSFKIVVTRGTFEEQLKPLGYQIASKENKGATETVAPFVKKEDKELNTKLELQPENDETDTKSELQQNDELDEEFGFKKGKKGNK